jgi:hypothetical protein
MATVESILALDAGGDEQTIRTLGGAYTSAISITRTADTNAYAANDAIGAATGSTAAKEFASIGAAGEHVEIMSAELLIEASALIASEAGYSLYLYDALPASAYGDNAAWDLPSGDRANFLGKIALGTPVDLGSTLYIRTNNLGHVVKLAASVTSLYAYLVTDAGYTPTSSRVYKVTLRTRRAN